MNIIDLETNFFGRKSILDLLKRRVIDLKEGYRQNIAFLGDRFIGKSSLLCKFIADLDDEAIVAIYLDLEHKNFQFFFSKFVGSILYRFSKMHQLVCHEDINLLMESTKKYIPQTVEAIKKIQANMAKGKMAESYRDLIALPELFTLESGKFCVIILDEFHHLEDFTVPNVFQDLGRKIMTQKRCLYIVASSLGGVARHIISERLSLLFGNFEMIQVTPFDVKTSQEFIAQNLRDIKISENLRNFLIDFTGGHPFYLNIICQKIMTLCSVYSQSEVFLPLLTQAIENTIFSRWSVLSRHFELAVNNLWMSKGNRTVLPILISLSNGKHKLQEISDTLKVAKNFVTQKVNRLIELGVVVKNGNFYYIQDKLLKYWIKYILQKRLSSIDASAAYQRLKFQEEIRCLVDDFTKVSQKDLPARIIELLRCFNDESFYLNGRLYKLPSFSGIVPLKLRTVENLGINLIQASSNEGEWFIVLKESMLNESDVGMFLSESKKLDQKPQRRVIISLSDLDANARLRALQEKMWIWNEDELNTLLSLYDKPYIVK